MTMTLSGGKRTGFKVGSDYYHSVTEGKLPRIRISLFSSKTGSMLWITI